MNASFQAAWQSTPRTAAHTRIAHFDGPEGLDHEAREAAHDVDDFMDETAREAIRTEARAQALEVITRVLIWLAEGNTLPQRGMRATVALYCVRPDLLDGCSLSRIGEQGGCTEQAAHKLAKQFRQTMNLQPEP